MGERMFSSIASNTGGEEPQESEPIMRVRSPSQNRKMNKKNDQVGRPIERN